MFLDLHLLWTCDAGARGSASLTTGGVAPIVRQLKGSPVNLFPWLESLLTRPAKAGAFAYEKEPDLAQGFNLDLGAINWRAAAA